MSEALSERSASTLWIILVTVASTVATLALACTTPFPALAALAAANMRRRDGIVLVLVAWVASQAMGFGVLHYPRDASTLVWSIAIGTEAVVSALAAETMLRRPGRPAAVALTLAYVAAFAAYKLSNLAWSFVLGGVAIAASPTWLATEFVRDGAFLIGLALLYRLLVTIGVPAPSSRLAVAA